MSPRRIAPVLILLGTLSIAARAAAPDGAAIYKERCALCHDGKPQPRMPTRAELATRSPEVVVRVLVSGVMAMQGAGLNEEELKAVARFVTTKDFSTTPEAITGMCTASGNPVAPAAGDWNGWGFDSGNSRYQPNPGIAAADVPKLKLKWAFGFPGDFMAFSQPSVVSGRIFVGSAGGTVYSLDASSGCIYWTYKAGASVRTSVTIAKVAGSTIAFFGDVQSTAHAVDAETGKPLWKVKLDPHPASRITGAPTFYNGKLFVPVSSIEEVSANSPKYECCKFRGSVASLDGATGKILWQSYSVLDPPKAYKKSKNGTQLYGPAGAAIWSSPTIDVKRKLVYAATGNSYTDVDIHTSDAVMAFNLETGSLVWVSQVQPKDNFIVGCPNTANCPEGEGPDFDFGSSPVLRSTGGGNEIIVAGQKSGVVWGLDPDNKGKVLWQRRVGQGSALGGVEWGHAADNENTYAAVSDRMLGAKGTPGLSAINLKTGEVVWSTPAPKVTCAAGVSCLPGQSSAVSVIPGAVFSGALNGHFRAYSTKTGEIIWDFDTAQSFETVNKVKAKGGSIDAPGPVISNGMVLTTSGYGLFGGGAGNVLLAFTVDGK